MGTEFQLGKTKLGSRWWWWLHNDVIVLNATELYTENGELYVMYIFPRTCTHMENPKSLDVTHTLCPLPSPATLPPATLPPAHQLPYWALHKQTHSHLRAFALALPLPRNSSSDTAAPSSPSGLCSNVTWPAEGPLLGVRNNANPLTPGSSL